MIRDDSLQRGIARKLIEDSELKAEEHISSGKLSAGILKWPAQWQVLKAIGVPQKPLDEYVLRMMRRGRDAEAFVLENMEGVVETQAFRTYRGCVGYEDALVDSNAWKAKVGVIPHEIKSKKNSKFKYIEKSDQSDLGDRMQGCFYALAEGRSYYAIDNVAADDYRILTHVYQVDEDYVAQAVNRIIQEFDQFTKAGVVPVFHPRDGFKWQADEQYCSYPEWQHLTLAEIELKLQKFYPEQYHNLKNYSKYIKRVEKEREARHETKEKAVAGQS